MGLLVLLDLQGLLVQRVPPGLLAQLELQGQRELPVPQERLAMAPRYRDMYT